MRFQEATLHKPRIAIGMNYRTNEEGVGRAYLDSPYFSAILSLGGIPIPILPISDRIYINELLSETNGLLLTGGLDLNPSLWNEPIHPQTELVHPDRQKFDFLFYKIAVEKKITDFRNMPGFTDDLCGSWRQIISTFTRSSWLGRPWSYGKKMSNIN